ncbi:MAG: hypothetical protein NVSMB25_14630 [Thermoleophilaceae bacterium]
MRTLLISDLHLGSRRARDVLRLPEARSDLISLARGADRVVLLGDTLELLDGTEAEALLAAGPLLEELAWATSGGEIVLVPGNHDHDLVRPWLDGRLRRQGSLALEEDVPVESSLTLEMIRASLAGSSLRVAYPGVWLRSDVYATHGHYLDAHLVPPLPLRLLWPDWQEWIGSLPEGRISPEDYERSLARAHAEIARHVRARRDDPEGRLRRAAGGVALAGSAVAPLVNRLSGGDGLAPFGAGLIGYRLRTAGIEAMSQVVGRLGIDAAHIVFGHIHRAGPLSSDQKDVWRAPSGPQLSNTGNWVDSPVLLAGASTSSPYWPGACVVVEDSGPPRALRLPRPLARPARRAA